MLEPLLAVVAHPDDESFGLGAVLAGLVARGRPVSLLCLTHGEASTLGTRQPRDADQTTGGRANGHQIAGGRPEEPADNDASHVRPSHPEAEGLGAIRQRELADAARRLGLDTVWLYDFPDGRLAQVDPGALDRLIASHVGAAGGLVVFEPGGVTGHPDHRAATAAAARVAEAMGLELVEWGLADEVAGQLRQEFAIPLVGLGGGPGVTTFHVDRSVQLAAIACHRSQAADNPVLARRLALQGDVELVRVRSGAGGGSRRGRGARRRARSPAGRSRRSGR